MTDGYVNSCKRLIHKAGFAFLLLLAFVVGAGYFGHKTPGGFLPDEDQGYMYGGLQLPNASSLQRTSDASKVVEKIMLDTPGVENVSSVIGYSMLSGVNTTYSSFFFVSFKNWEERKTAEESYLGIKKHLTAALSKVTSGIAFAFPPPAIPGVGTSGGFTFVLEDAGRESCKQIEGAVFPGIGSIVGRSQGQRRPKLGRESKRRKSVGMTPTTT